MSAPDPNQAAPLPALPAEPTIGLTLAGVVLLLLFQGLTVLRYAPPAARGADAPPRAFSAERALKVHARVFPDTPHPVGSPANDAVRARLIAELTGLGFQPQVQQAFPITARASCAQVHNVLVRLEGSKPGQDLLLMAHYDSVGAGPGAADDGAGTVALLEVARALKLSHPTPERGVIFLFTDGEEGGLFGARAFVEEHPWFADVHAVINVEARGTGGPSLMFETGADDRELVELFARVPRPVGGSAFSTVYDAMPNDTDFSPFKRAGVRGLNFGFIGNVAGYHTPLDDLAHLNPGSVQQHGDALLSITRAAAEGGLPGAAGDAAFFDLFAWVVVRWPLGLTPALADLALVFLLVSLALRARRRGMRVLLRAGGGLLGFLAALVLALVVGTGLSALFAATGAVPFPWIAEPRPYLLMLWAAALASLALAGAGLGRLLGFWPVWSGTWLAWSILALVLSELAPGIAYLFLVPSLGAGLAGFLSALLEPHRPRLALGLAALLPLGLAGMLLLPTCHLMVDALGLSGIGPVYPLPATMALSLTALLPLLSARGQPRRWVLINLGLATLLASGVVALTRAPFSAESPRRVIAGFHQEDGGNARWLLVPMGGPLPEFAAQLPWTFTREAKLAFPWSRSFERAYTAPAALLPQPPPELAELESEDLPGGRAVRGLLRSPRGARQVALLLPPGTPLRALVLAGKRREAAQLHRRRGWVTVWCHALPEGGLPLTIELEGHAPLEAVLLDAADGLPAAGAVIEDMRTGAGAATSHVGDLTLITRRQPL